MELSSYSDSEIRQAVESIPSLWAATLRNEAALPIDFNKRKYLIDIYNDFSPKQVLLKPPQIGASTMNTLKAFYVARFLKRDIIYTMPTDAIVSDFVTGTINRITAQNEILASWVKDHDSVERKEIGNNIIRFRGTWNPKQAMTVPASLLIHDELDASDIENVVLYETRQEAQERAEDKWRWYFSHPSRKGFGVDIYWAQSDKKEWFITCPACSAEQFLSWPESIDMQSQQYVCKECKRVLSTEARIKGQWKPTGTGVFSGYHVSQLMLFNKSAQDIVEAYNDPMKSEQFFYNYVLGLPYAGGADTITTQEVLNNVKDTFNYQEDRVIIGVDTGLPYYYVLMNKDGVFNFGTCDGKDHIERLLKNWPRSIVVSDAQGDLTPMRELQQKYSGRIFLGYLRKIQNSQVMISWGEKEKWGEVLIDRNRMLSLMVEWLKEGKRLVFNGTKEEWTPFAQHFENIWREEITIDDKPHKDNRSLYGLEYVWKTRKPDHWCFALLFALVGFDKFGTMPEVVTGDNELFAGLKTGRMFIE